MNRRRFLRRASAAAITQDHARTLLPLGVSRLPAEEGMSMRDHFLRNAAVLRFVVVGMRFRLTALLILCAAGVATAAEPVGEAAPSAAVMICPAPDGEPLSEDFCVTVGGVSAPVYTARVSAKPLNFIWPGFPNIRCERPLDQTEIASFAYWDVSGPAKLEIVSTRPIESVAVRPASRGIQPVVEGNRISFVMPGPGYLTVEVNGTARALHLFASPVEEHPPVAGDPGVRYFGPGMHRPGTMHLGEGETLYIAPGAVVYGAVLADDVENVRICGRGILDVSALKRGQTPGAISLAGCRNARIEGVIIRDVNRWAVVPAACEDVTISWLKLIGFWRYNADGINVVNSRRVRIDDCFIRAFDDCITMKGVDRQHHRFVELGRGHPIDELPVRHVRVSRCVIWNDWGQALKIGSETSAPEIADVVFEDCDVIRTMGALISIRLCSGARVHDIRFENIRFETHDNVPVPRIQKTLDETFVQPERSNHCPGLVVMKIEKSYWGFTKIERLGSIRDIVIKDISVTGPCFPRSALSGESDDSCIDHVVVDNLRHNGKRIVGVENSGITIGNFVTNVRVQ